VPSMLCNCGERLRYGDIPCAIEWLVISDVEYDKVSGTVDAEELYRSMTHILQCPKCRRLWVYWNGFSQPPSEYMPKGNDGGGGS
jgi:hypothetical protein